MFSQDLKTLYLQKCIVLMLRHAAFQSYALVHQQRHLLSSSMVKKGKQNNQEHSEDTKQKQNKGISAGSMRNEAAADADADADGFRWRNSLATAAADADADWAIIAKFAGISDKDAFKPYMLVGTTSKVCKAGFTDIYSLQLAHWQTGDLCSFTLDPPVQVVGLVPKDLDSDGSAGRRIRSALLGDKRDSLTTNDGSVSVSIDCDIAW